ncbi:hypothetical protein [Mycobacterium attenuatum]|uniref:hypothetical protein n=1 Tax=Mycobacterium attenuatum TaxID=2341086 RepID=UPI000F105A9A|nr:hypothetical protein [Mycobacterium attenuatum]VBA62465.1 hypothetical protein LAUMK41_05856 [Mycobacterium attenuatum]
MKRLIAPTFMAAAMLWLCAAPVASAITGDELCKAMHWPMPLSATVGWSLVRLSNDSILSCFDNVTAIAPDGHDAMNDPASQAYTWKVTSMTPAAGTLVPMDQKIALTVVRDPNAPS